MTGDIVFELSQSNSRGVVLYMFTEKEELTVERVTFKKCFNVPCWNKSDFDLNQKSLLDSS